MGASRKGEVERGKSDRILSRSLRLVDRRTRRRRAAARLRPRCTNFNHSCGPTHEFQPLLRWTRNWAGMSGGWQFVAVHSSPFAPALEPHKTTKPLVCRKSLQTSGCRGCRDAGGGTRTPDTRIMIPLSNRLSYSGGVAFFLQQALLRLSARHPQPGSDPTRSDQFARNPHSLLEQHLGFLEALVRGVEQGQEPSNQAPKSAGRPARVREANEKERNCNPPPTDHAVPGAGSIQWRRAGRTPSSATSSPASRRGLQSGRVGPRRASWHIGQIGPGSGSVMGRAPQG